MRICHLAKYYDPAQGGIETVVRETADGLADGGDDVTVACINHRNSRGQDVTYRRFAATRSVRQRVGSVTVHRFARMASVARFDVSPSLPLQLARLFRQGFDVIHLHEPNPAMTLGLSAVKAPCPLVVTYHSDVVKQHRLGSIYQPFQSAVLRRADHILCSSIGYRNGSTLLQSIGRPVTILPFGIRLDRHLSSDPEIERQASVIRTSYGTPLWLMVGRLVYYKGHRIAIEALADVPGTLAIIGTGPLEPELRRLASERGVADRVAWLGSMSDTSLIGAYRAATGLWFPSTHRSEAFGLVQVEAMANGCPVINSRIPGSGVSEVSLHQVSGLTIDCDQPAALAAAANHLLSNGPLRQRLSVGARERAIALFGRSRMIDTLSMIYRDVAGTHVIRAPRGASNNRVRQRRASKSPSTRAPV